MAVNEQASRDATSKAPVLVYSVNQDGWPASSPIVPPPPQPLRSCRNRRRRRSPPSKGVPPPCRGYRRRRRRRRRRTRRLGRMRYPLWDHSLHRGSKENKRPARLWSPPAALHQGRHGLAFGARKPASGGCQSAGRAQKRPSLRLTGSRPAPESLFD